MTAIERRHVSARMSESVRHGDVALLCGRTAHGAGIADIRGRAAEMMARIDALLAEAGTDRSRLLAAPIRPKDIGDLAAMNAAREARAPGGSAPADGSRGACGRAELVAEITAAAAA